MSHQLYMLIGLLNLTEGTFCDMLVPIRSVSIMSFMSTKNTVVLIIAPIVEQKWMK